MRARIISLVFGITIMLVVLGLQLITGCTSIKTNANASIGAIFFDMSEVLGNGMLVKITIASIVIVAISLVVLLADRYLDRQALKNKKSA